MITKEQVRQAFRGLFEQYIKSSALRPSIACKVIGVSSNTTDGTMTCDCEPIDGTSVIEDVKLIADNNYSGFICVPSVDSIVIVSFKSDSDAFISMMSQVDKIYLNGNDYGGLVEVQPLVQKLNNLENKVNALITFSQTHTHSGVTVGSGITGTGTPPVTGNLIPTQKSDLENTMVEHGQGNLT